MFPPFRRKGCTSGTASVALNSRLRSSFSLFSWMLSLLLMLVALLVTTAKRAAGCFVVLLDAINLADLIIILFYFCLWTLTTRLLTTRISTSMIYPTPTHQHIKRNSSTSCHPPQKPNIESADSSLGSGSKVFLVASLGFSLCLPASLEILCTSLLLT